MTLLRFFAICVLGAAAAGCQREATFVEPIGPRAAITWLNVVPDTGALDLRVVDIPSNAGLFDASFRGAKIYPEGIEAGSRRIKVFISSTNPAITQLFIVDTTFNFVADQRYSFYVSGFSRAGRTPAVRAVVTSASPPALGAGQIAIRILNLAPSFAGANPTLPDTTVPADAFVRSIGAAPGGTPEVLDLSYLESSPSYLVLPTGRYTVGLRGTGATGPVFVAAPVPPGQTTAPAIGGSLVTGTAITAVILPRSVISTSGRPTGRATDTTVAEASRRMARSNDTVTVQSGSISILTNRPDSVIGPGDTLKNRADSVVGRTGTGGSTLVAAGDVVFVESATQPEYNGWQAVLAGSGDLGASGVADSLSCNPVATGDTAKKCAASNAIATTRFRFKYRIVGTPASPATGAPTYRIYAPLSSADMRIPFITFVIDRRP